MQPHLVETKNYSLLYPLSANKQFSTAFITFYDLPYRYKAHVSTIFTPPDSRLSAIALNISQSYQLEGQPLQVPIPIDERVSYYGSPLGLRQLRVCTALFLWAQSCEWVGEQCPERRAFFRQYFCSGYLYLRVAKRCGCLSRMGMANYNHNLFRINKQLVTSRNTKNTLWLHLLAWLHHSSICWMLHVLVISLLCQLYQFQYYPLISPFVTQTYHHLNIFSEWYCQRCNTHSCIISHTSYSIIRYHIQVNFIITMGNCCPQHPTIHHLPPQQHQQPSLPLSHHSQSAKQPPYQQYPPKQTLAQLKTMANTQIKSELHSQIKSVQHEADIINTHQTTNNSIVINERTKYHPTVSPSNRQPCNNEQINSIVSPIVGDNHTISDKQYDQLQPKRKQFLNSTRLFNGLNRCTDVAKLLELATQANQLGLFLQQKSIYMRSLSYVDLLKHNYTHQSIQQVKAYIYRQLTTIAIKQNDQLQADTFILRAIECYKQAVAADTIEQHIGLMNNYAVFKLQCNRWQESKRYLLMAIQLMNKYYTVQDDRKYMAMLNLVCIQYEKHHYYNASGIAERIKSQCKHAEIVHLAISNQLYYQHPPKP